MLNKAKCFLLIIVVFFITSCSTTPKIIYYKAYIGGAGIIPSIVEAEKDKEDGTLFIRKIYLPYDKVISPDIDPGYARDVFSFYGEYCTWEIELGQKLDFLPKEPLRGEKFSTTGDYVATPGGNKYHIRECYHLANSPESNFLIFDNPCQAELYGYEPCMDCIVE